MTELGLDQVNLHHELQVLCTDLIYDFAKRKATVDDAAKAYGYVRNTFRNLLETRLTELANERRAQLSEDPIEDDPTTERWGMAQWVDETPRLEEVDERLRLTMMMDSAGCSEREKQALVLRFEQDLEGEGLAAALGVRPKTADELLRRGRAKIQEKFSVT